MNESSSFNFEEWAELARNNPEAFEQRRKEVIEEAIAQSPEAIQQRLRCIQWRVDMERMRYKDPLVACARIYNMMWELVYKDGGLLDALNQLGEYNVDEQGEIKEKKRAKILAFKS